MVTRVTVPPASVATVSLHWVYSSAYLYNMGGGGVKVGMGELPIVQKIKVKLVNGESQAYFIVMNVFNCN